MMPRGRMLLRQLPLSRGKQMLQAALDKKNKRLQRLPGLDDTESFKKIRLDEERQGPGKTMLQQPQCLPQQQPTVRNAEVDQSYTETTRTLTVNSPVQSAPDQAEATSMHSRADSEDEETLCEVGIDEKEQSIEDSLSDSTPSIDPDWRPSSDTSTHVSSSQSSCSDQGNAGDSDTDSIVYLPQFPFYTKQKDDESQLGMMGRGLAKQHYCLYCSKAVSKMARHLEQKHSLELEVAHALSLNKNSKERHAAWDSLRKKGDFQHNFSCREQKKGVLIPKYRCKRATVRDVDDYVSCSECLGLYLKNRLWQHQKSCKKDATERKGGVRAGKLLDPVSVEEQQLRDEVLVNMNDDSVKKCIENDKLIMAYGRRLLEKNTDLHKKAYIANKLRELGRFVNSGQKSKLWKNLEEALDPKNFENVVQVCKNVAGQNADKGFDSPSTALKLGYSLSSCCSILKCKALMECDESLKQKCLNFEALYKSEWHSRISYHAHRVLHERKFNNPKRLPFVTDCVKLQNHLKSCANKAHELIETGNVQSGIVELAQVCLAQVILFNRRRSGEAERLKVAEFKTAMQVDDRENVHDAEILMSLTEFEKRLYASHCKVETRGKKGRKVPIILTEDMRKSISVLLEHRSEAGINSEFLFAKPACRYPIRGCDVMRRFSKEADLQCPQLMTSTRLRQQLGTHCQVLGLSDNSQDILATFMGHDIRIHRNFYRLPDNILQLAKVSKVLHALNSGKMSQFQGQDFDAITFNMQEPLEDEDEDNVDEMVEEAGEIPQASSSENEPRSHKVDQDLTHSFRNAKSRNAGKQSPLKRDLEEDSSEIDDSDEDSESWGEKAKKRRLGVRKRKPCQKRKWSSAEIAAVERSLGRFLRDLILPGKLDIVKAQETESSLKMRSWTSIKYYFKNRFSAVKRKSCK